MATSSSKKSVQINLNVQQLVLLLILRQVHMENKPATIIASNLSGFNVSKPDNCFLKEEERTFSICSTVEGKKVSIEDYFLSKVVDAEGHVWFSSEEIPYNFDGEFQANISIEEEKILKEDWAQKIVESAIVVEAMTGFDYNMYFAMDSAWREVQRSEGGKILLAKDRSVLKQIGEHLQKGFPKDFAYKNSDETLKKRWPMLLDLFFEVHKIDGESPLKLGTFEEVIEWCFQNAA